MEAVRDFADPHFGVTFFLPVENSEGEDDEGEDGETEGAPKLNLCKKCGEMAVGKLPCRHESSMKVIRQEPPKDEDRADQMARCSVCGYNAAGRDPVRELIHGADGPHAVIATTLHRNLPNERKKVLAFADGRQEAAFFAWYLQESYKDILSRNLLLRVVEQQAAHSPLGSSLEDLATGLREIFREKNVFPPATSDLQLKRGSWLAAYRELLTDESRISLEGVGLVRWCLKWPDWFQATELLSNPPWSLSANEARELTLVLLDSMRTDRAVELRCGAAINMNWDDLGLQAAQLRFRIGDPKGQKIVRSWDGKRGRRVQFLVKLLKRIRSDIPESETIDLAMKTTREIWENLRCCDQRAPTPNDRLLIPVDDARRLNPDWWRIQSITKSDSVFQCDTCGRLQVASVRTVCPRPRCPGSLEEIRRQALEPNHYRLLYDSELPASLRVEEHTAQLENEKAREFQREFREGNIHVLSCSTTFELGVDLGNLDTIFLRNVPPESFNYAQRVGRAGRRRGFPGFAITYCRRAPHDLYYFADPQRMLAGKVKAPFLTLRNEKIIGRHIVATALSAFFRASPERFTTVASLFKDLAKPSAVADFRAFLQDQRSRLEESLSAIVPTDMMGQLGLSDGAWAGKIASQESQFSLAEEEVSSDYQAVTTLESKFAGAKDYNAAKWAQARARTIAEEDVLSFLSRKAVIPKYGFPVDVVELDIQKTQTEVSLQRDLTIALSEFAPTSRLVANKKEWTSYGLKRVAGKEWERKCYKRCPKHNVFLRWKKGGENEPPSPCADGLEVREYVIPSFGFTTDRSGPREPVGRTARVFTTRPYFAGPVEKERGSIDMPVAFPLVTINRASPGWMAVLCEGRRGAGFYVCGTCGAGFRKREKMHKTPYGEACRGALAQVSLGHEFVTDVLQIQFHAVPAGNFEPIWFAHSLAYAMVEGAASEVLQIPATDLNAVVGSAQDDKVPPIILYDNVPGGAGLVARLEDEAVFKATLAAAYARVSGKCGCDESTSCYGCLRSYKNQFAHQNLRRGDVMHYLEELRVRWKQPQETIVDAVP